MSKRALRKIISILFFISILLISYLELKNKIQEIKMEYTNRQIIEMKTNVKEPENGLKNSSVYWKAIERKDSYNNELQFYSTDNVVIKEDTIEIISKRETRDNKMYTSGLVESTNAYKYGYFKFNIEISKGKGIFPAIWFLPNDGGGLPEIDLFEMIGSAPYTFYGVIHFQKDGIQDSDYYTYEVPIKEEYSVSLKWTAKSITWYIDGQEIYSTAQGVPQEYMYIIINQAIGGDWPGNPDNDTVFPNQFKIISKQIEPIFKKGRD